MKELILKANGQEIKVYAEENELAKLTKPERAQTGYERVDNDETYFSHGFYTSPIRRESDDERDNIHFSRGDYVNDKNLFYGIERADELHNCLKQWQALHDEPVDWGNNKPKYHIQFDYQQKEIGISGACYTRDEGVVYFTTFEKAKEATEAFLDKLMWYYTKDRSRLDEKRTEANTQT